MVETAVGEFQPADHIGGVNKMVEPAKAETGVRYWRHPNSADFCKTVDGLIAETVGTWAVEVGTKLSCPMCLETPVSESEFLAAKKAEEAAKHPAPVSRAPVEPLDPMCGTIERTEKLNELIARVNALEGGGK